ncbi:hypothetical protein ACPXCG_19340 [Gordonia sp. DT218]|uniref:hypothetical protein n=1 Tax=unclassified Gordonia (in: high G+C Gram-positive bacteria) TaxID=2657482 RepID=UPI003CF8CBFE
MTEDPRLGSLPSGSHHGLPVPFGFGEVPLCRGAITGFGSGGHAVPDALHAPICDLAAQPAVRDTSP